MRVCSESAEINDINANCVRHVKMRPMRHGHFSWQALCLMLDVLGCSCRGRCRKSSGGDVWLQVNVGVPLGLACFWLLFDVVALMTLPTLGLA